jgi:hypothetical protein
MPSLCKQGVRGSSPLGSTYFPLSKPLSARPWRCGLRHLQQQTAAVGHQRLVQFRFMPDHRGAGSSSTVSGRSSGSCATVLRLLLESRRCRPATAVRQCSVSIRLTHEPQVGSRRSCRHFQARASRVRVPDSTPSRSHFRGFDHLSWSVSWRGGLTHVCLSPEPPV